MKLHLSWALLAAAALLGCSDESGLSTGPSSEDLAFQAPAPGKAPGSSGNLDTDSRARIVFFDDVGMKVVSDAWTGADGTSAYVGNECGVEAKLFYYNEDKSRSGDLVFDADMNGSKCKRWLVFRFPAENGGDYKAAPFVNVNKSMQVGATANDVLIAAKTGKREYYSPRANPAIQRLKFPIGKTLCETLTYEGVQVTRTAGTFDDPDADAWGQWDKDADDAGAWIVESLAGADDRHAATCTYTQRGVTQTGATYDMPFRFQVTELLVW